jgi:hypothetical protein
MKGKDDPRWSARFYAAPYKEIIGVETRTY